MTALRKALVQLWTTGEHVEDREVAAGDESMFKSRISDTYVGIHVWIEEQGKRMCEVELASYLGWVI
jgi:hypothetical protein